MGKIRVSVSELNFSTFIYGLNIFIAIQTSKTLIQMDINMVTRMDFFTFST